MRALAATDVDPGLARDQRSAPQTAMAWRLRWQFWPILRGAASLVTSRYASCSGILDGWSAIGNPGPRETSPWMAGAPAISCAARRDGRLLRCPAHLFGTTEQHRFIFHTLSIISPRTHSIAFAKSLSVTVYMPECEEPDSPCLPHAPVPQSSRASVAILDD